jgi:hypothetical protein
MEPSMAGQSRGRMPEAGTGVAPTMLVPVLDATLEGGVALVEAGGLDALEDFADEAEEIGTEAEELGAVPEILDAEPVTLDAEEEALNTGVSDKKG